MTVGYGFPKTVLIYALKKKETNKSGKPDSIVISLTEMVTTD